MATASELKILAIERLEEAELLYLTKSGLSRQLEFKTQQDAAFAKDWSKVVDWSEQRRYDFVCRQSTVKQFIVSVKKVMQWIKQHW